MPKKLITKLAAVIFQVINFQLVFSPMALAQDNTQGSHKEKKWTRAANNAGQFSEFLLKAAHSYAQSQNGGAQGNVQMIQNQLSNSLQIKPIDARQVPAVFRGCAVLPAGGATLTGAMSCSGADTMKIQQGYADAVLNIAEFNKQQLKNFQTSGHERYTSQGVGCYAKKIEDFSGLLNAREEELSKLKINLEKRISDFKKAAKADLDKIKLGSAILTGKPSNLIKNKKLEDLFVGKNKDPNGICGSVVDASILKNAVKRGGLMGVEETLFSRMNKPSKGSLSSSELLSRANNISKEIGSMAAAIGSHAANQRNLQMDLTGTSYRSREFDKNSPALKAIQNQYNNDLKSKLSKKRKNYKISQMLSGNNAPVKLAEIEEGNINLTERLENFEKQSKRKCLTQVISSKSNFGDINSFARSFHNPNVSKKFNREADNAFATHIATQLMNQNLDVDQVLASIKEQEELGTNSSKIIMTGKTISLPGIKIDASTPMRASQMVRYFVQNCKNEFESSKNSDGYTKRDMVNNLTNYYNDVEKIRRTAKSDITTLIKDELLSCASDKSTGKASMSCSNALNMSSSNFCVRTATTCASNFKGCHEKAQKQVEHIKKQQVATAEVYKGKVAKLKAALSQDIALVNQFMEAQARSLDAQLGVGTVFNVPPMIFDKNKFFGFQGKGAKGLDEELELEDPEEMLKLASKQIDALTKQLAKQKRDQIKKLEGMKKEYVSNYRKQERHWDKTIRECSRRIGQVQEMMNKEAEQIAKDNETIARECMKIQAFNADKDCGTVGDLMETVQEAAMLSAGPVAQIQNSRGLASSNSANSGLGTLQQIRKTCGKYDGGGKTNFHPSELAKYCENSPVSSCDAFNKYIGKRDTCSDSIDPKNLNDLVVCSQGGKVHLSITGNCGEDESIVTLKSNDKIDAIAHLRKQDGSRELINEALNCYDPYNLTSNQEAALEAVRADYIVHEQDKEIGEKHVSMAMCNGGFDGEYEDGWASFASDIGTAIGTINVLRD